VSTSEYIDKLRSIALPQKKRGSHRYNTGGNARTVQEAIREVKGANPRAGTQEMQNAAYREAMGAGSWQKCADLIEVTAKEIGQQLDPDAVKGVTMEWSDSKKTEEKK